MYDWVTHTWNAIKGKCPHDCSYCYMKRWGRLGETYLDKREFKTDLGTGNFIFVGSSCDMFADDIPADWIIKVLDFCLDYPENKYLFQTKNPQGFSLFIFPEYSEFCTTLETNRWYPQMNNAPMPADRLKYIPFASLITVEPIMDFDIDQFVEMLEFTRPKQVNIGADSGKNGLPEPGKEKILLLIEELQKFTIVKQKKNLKRLIC